MPSEHQPLLSVQDTRALLRLLNELRELGDQPSAWRAHLVSELGKLCGARLSTAHELAVHRELRQGGEGGEAHEPGIESCGHVVASIDECVEGLSESQRPRFHADVFDMPNAIDPAFPALRPLYGGAFTRSRGEPVGDKAWYRSRAANERLKAYDCDDYIKSMEPVTLAGQAPVLSSITLYRGWRESRFGARERALVQLVHEELSADWRRVHAATNRLAGLPPRVRKTAELLLGGLSEKQVAGELGLSQHTVHQYVKALYRELQVQSRGELHAKLSPPSRAHVRLASEHSPV
jgi:DNA-binding CsgD family transcriptional regulator